MDVRTKWGIAGLVLGLAAALTLPTIAQTPDTQPAGDSDRTVATTGTAIVRTAPDEAVVTLGVQTEAVSAEDAMAENADRMNAVIGALLNQGLGEDDLATSWINLWPRYADSGLTVIGYTAENQLAVTVRDLGKIGRVIDRAIASGANLTSGITFRVSDGSIGLERALEEAVADARRKAEVLAAAGGASLGAVVSISEVGSTVPPPIYYEERYAAAEGAASTPILPPTMESQVSVTVVWALA